MIFTISSLIVPTGVGIGRAVIPGACPAAAGVAASRMTDNVVA